MNMMMMMKVEKKMMKKKWQNSGEEWSLFHRLPHLHSCIVVAVAVVAGELRLMFWDVVVVIVVVHHE